MTSQIDELPYAYAANSRAASYPGVIMHGVATAVLFGLDHFGYLTVAGWLIALPMILLFARSYLYTLLVNAFHTALRQAEADSYLDTIVETAAEARDAEERKSALTPGFFTEQFFPQRGDA